MVVRAESYSPNLQVGVQGGPIKNLALAELPFNDFEELFKRDVTRVAYLFKSEQCDFVRRFLPVHDSPDCLLINIVVGCKGSD
jgi:hypothetical protein